MDRNQHVKNYLAYYAGFSKPPHYAVMLNGPWGIGKTFLLKAFLRSQNAAGRKTVYVSLYGLTNIEEIDDAIFRSLFPFFDTKTAQIGGRLLKSAGKFFRVEPDIKSADVFSKSAADLFIFDDLERCEIAINRVLGYINEFVEHDGLKVIIVANEAEIRERDSYARIREKLIGKTLEIQSAFEEALQKFTDDLADADTKLLLASKTEQISRVYHQSELKNLRLLQQTMWEFERFYRALDDTHRQNDQAVTDLLEMTFALSIDIKAGRLMAEDLRKRRHSYAFSAMRSREPDYTPSNFSKSQQRYRGIDFESNALSDDTLIDILTKGIVDEDKIRLELNASSYFVQAGNEPAWRTVWHAFQRPEPEIRAALEKMEHQFQQRDFTVYGEILHVFGMRLWLAGIGEIPGSRATVVEDGKRYIDDLYNAKRLPPAPLSSVRLEDAMSGGYDGLGIHEASSPDFNELVKYLNERRAAAATDLHPEIANQLLADMLAKPGEFYGRVAFVNGGSNEFYATPVFAALDPDKFVHTFLQLSTIEQHSVLTALNGRYDQHSLSRELAPEEAWIRSVRKGLVVASKTMSPLGRDRMQSFLRHTLDKVLGPDDADRGRGGRRRNARRVRLSRPQFRLRFMTKEPKG